MTSHPRTIATVALVMMLGCLVAGSATASAQDVSRAMLTAASCAPAAGSGAPPAGALRLVGGQKPEPRSIFGPGDLLVVGGGSAQGVQLGQQFFVRRARDWGMRKNIGVHAVNTVGGIRIIAVNNGAAIASIDFACEALMVDDFLVPYVEPVLPPNVMRTDVSGELDFSSPGHILFGNDDHFTAGAGAFMVADIGVGHGAAPGARFAVYRDLRMPGVPLEPVGEAIVVFAGPDTSIVRFTLARDAVVTGDLLIPHKH